MKLLGDLRQVTETKAKVGLVHNMPFDEVNGLHKTQEELEQIGILVDEIPEPQIPTGQQVSGMFVNPETKEVWYEYEDVPLTPEQQMQSQIDDLNMAMAALMGGAE